MLHNNTRTHNYASENYAHTYFAREPGANTVRRMNVQDKIRAILHITGWTQAQLAEELKVTQPTVNRWLRGTEPEGHRRDDINDLFQNIEGASIPERYVKLVGRVGAGQAVMAIADNDETHTAPAPSDALPSTVAVEVSGDSMFPAFEEGTILYYSRLLPPREMVNRRAVVQLGDGRIFVKIVRPGTTPNTWTLQSVNTQYAAAEPV